MIRFAFAALIIFAANGCADRCAPAQNLLGGANQAVRLCKMKLHIGQLEMDTNGKLDQGVLSCAGEEQEQRIAEARVAASCR